MPRWHLERLAVGRSGRRRRHHEFAARRGEQPWTPAPQYCGESQKLSFDLNFTAPQYCGESQKLSFDLNFTTCPPVPGWLLFEGSVLSAGRKTTTGCVFSLVDCFVCTARVCVCVWVARCGT